MMRCIQICWTMCVKRVWNMCCSDILYFIFVEQMNSVVVETDNICEMWPYICSRLSACKNIWKRHPARLELHYNPLFFCECGVHRVVISPKLLRLTAKGKAVDFPYAPLFAWRKNAFFCKVVSEKICVLGGLKNSSISLVCCNIFTMDFWCGFVTTFSKRISVLLVYNCFWPSFHIHLSSSTFSPFFFLSFATATWKGAILICMCYFFYIYSSISSIFIRFHHAKVTTVDIMRNYCLSTTKMINVWYGVWRKRSQENWKAKGEEATQPSRRKEDE